MTKSNAIRFAVLVAALGYFVDAFDILLFSVVRTPSLKSLGIGADSLLDTGIFLLNCQMTGMLLGGILWGIWGDKKGRISVLFGSILLYSLANLANGFVHGVDAYALCRFLAGIGLAGELGAGITLVAESLPREKRGLGTTIVATVGVTGSLVAAIVARFIDWRTAYIVAGLMGFSLLIFRISIQESGLFKNLQADPQVKRGDLRMLLSSGKKVRRFLYCLLPGVPIYFVLGLLVTFGPELADAKGLTGMTGADAVFYCYIGFILGDLSSGLLSQYCRSRKKVLTLFVSLTLVSSLFVLLYPFATLLSLYVAYIFLGFSAGYWAVFVTVAAEQFGTNLRSTVATTIPNFVRGTVVLLTFGVRTLKPHGGLVMANTGLLVGCVLVAFAAISRLKETFGSDLEFLER